MATFSTTPLHSNKNTRLKALYSHSASSIAALHQKLFTWDIA